MKVIWVPGTQGQWMEIVYYHGPLPLESLTLDLHQNWGSCPPKWGLESSKFGGTPDPLVPERFEDGPALAVTWI